MEARAVSEDERVKELKLSEDRVEFYKTDPAIVTARANITAIPEYSDKIDAIKDKEGEESLPIIINVLLNIQEVLLADVSALQKKNPAAAEKFKETIAILEKIVTIFGETDKVTQGGLDAQKEYLKKLKAAAEKRAKETNTEVNVFADLEMLVEDAYKVEFTENTAPLWMELATWMEGLYWHNAHNITHKIDPVTNEPTKSNDGVISPWNKKLYYPRVDKLDGIIFKLFDITKLDVSINYHRASVFLRKKIEEFVPELARSVSPVEVGASTKPDAPSAIDFNMETMQSQTEGYSTSSVRIKEADIPAGTSIPDIVQSMFANPLGVMLSRKAHLNAVSRIEDFAEQLAVYGLSEVLKESLAGFSDSANAVLDSYTNPATLHVTNPARYLPTFIPGVSLFKKVNDDHASNTKAALVKLNNDVTKQLQLMIDLSKTLDKSHSTRLLPAVIKLLLNQIDIIRKCPDAHASRIKYNMEVLPADYQGYITLQIDIADKDVQMGQIICKAIQGFFSNPLGLALAPMIDCDADARLQHFSRMLKIHGLTPMQKVEFANFRARATARLNGYTDPSNYSILNPVRLVGRDVIPFGVYLENVHAPLADATIGKMMCATSVTDQIRYMLEMRLKLKSETSQKLEPEVTKFLIEFINGIIPAHAYCAKRAETIELQPASQFANRK